MSKFMIPGFGWLYFVVVIDWFTKMILGLSVGGRGDTSLWLHALSDAGLKAFPEDGVRGKGVHLISDNGSQPTSKRYMAECVHLDIEQIFTTYDNPRGNADTERVIRTLKEEAVWPYEHETPMAAEAKLRETVEFYNTVYCHSSLGYMSPAEFAAAFFSNVGKTMVGINGVKDDAPGFNRSNDLGSSQGDGPPLSSGITTTEVAA